ncbi:Ger(x)C family spore germination protein [Salirhabdus sp. Marseille-P4669]|uniref:Ger(x)C family spore germination protein n=1 Tax=Salirhabdus sp. Marseille-P4669 TaxID=2042310 RepID=UPI000C7D02A0|nr:Ger(x)C family spore germination protein [Salirhabdus sp. Marseille-P4669]
MAKFVKVIMIVVLCTVLSSCWDSIELEDRAFTYGIAIDLVNKGADDNVEIMLTNQVIAPSGFSTIGGGGGGSEEAFRNISRTGKSLFQINQDFSKQTNRTVNAQHLQVILISEELLREPKILNKLFDTFIRGHEMRRGIKVATTNGQAKELFTIKPEHIKVPVDYIARLLEVQSFSETIYPIRIGDIQEDLITNMSFPIPHLKILDEKNIEYDGVSVFNSTNKNIVGNLTSEETKGFNFLTGRVKSGTVIFQYKGNQLVARDIRGKAKIKLKNKDKQNLSFAIDISLFANLGENYGPYNTYHIRQYGKPLEDEIKRIVESTINKLQQELNTDIIGLNKYLRGRHYSLWQSIKDDWEQGENYFQKSKIKVNVNVSMKNEGNAINTSEDRKGP